jgi:hypothetical protein
MSYKRLVNQRNALVSAMADMKNSETYLIVTPLVAYKNRLNKKIRTWK